MIGHRLIDYIRLLNRRRVYCRLLNKPCDHHPDGFLYSGRGSTMLTGGREPFQADLIKNLLDKVNIFVNIGAHHGYYVCLALNSSTNTIAYEPEPINISMIEKHVKANDFLSPFTLHPSAVGAEDGELTLFGGNSGGSLLTSNDRSTAPKAQQQQVKVVTLNDTLVLKNEKTLCLMDVEGFEYEVLKGSSKILGDGNKPLWIIEVWPDDGDDGVNPNFLNIFSLMDTHGYKVWGIDEQAMKLVEMSINMIKSIATGQTQINFANFLFVPEGDDIVDSLRL